MPRRLITYAVIILVILVIPVSQVGWLRDRTTRFLSPLTGFLSGSGISVQNYFYNLGQIGEIQDERARLQAEVVTLQQQLSDQEGLRRENESLRKELGITGVVRDTNKVFSKIIIQGLDPLDRTVTIDAGRAQGIRQGQPAIYQGSLAGRVETVRESTSIVRLITSPKSILQAWVATKKENGILQGDGNTVSFKEVNQGVLIEVGSLVETSGLGGSLPQGIPIGSVEQLSSSPNSLSQSFRVTLPYDPNSIESLIILLTNQQ